MCWRFSIRETVARFYYTTPNFERCDDAHELATFPDVDYGFSGAAKLRVLRGAERSQRTKHLRGVL
jgi:hypothetical protein